jgi:hypothetical protein
VQHDVHRAVDVDVVGDVVLDELEIQASQVSDVGNVSGQQVVDPDNAVALLEQGLGQVRSDESGGAGNDNAWFGHEPASGNYCLCW